jgi:hypothetical protein
VDGVLNSAACENVTAANVSKCVTGKRVRDALKIVQNRHGQMYTVTQTQAVKLAYGNTIALKTVAAYNVSDKSLSLCETPYHMPRNRRAETSRQKRHDKNVTKTSRQRYDEKSFAAFKQTYLKDICSYMLRIFPGKPVIDTNCSNDGSLIQFRGVYDEEEGTEWPAPPRVVQLLASLQPTHEATVCQARPVLLGVQTV